MSYEDMVRSTGGVSDRSRPERRVLCLKERKMIQLITLIDCLTVLRIPGVICSVISATRGLRFYYKFRVITFWFFLLCASAGFAFLIGASFRDEASSATVILSGIFGGAMLVFDHFANKVMKRYFLREVRREQIHLQKMKGRMLSQKAHKGSIRIDTPRSQARSDARSIGSRSNKIGQVSMSQQGVPLPGGLPSSRDQS